MPKVPATDVRKLVFYALQELRKRQHSLYKLNPRPLKDMGKWLEDTSRVRKVRGGSFAQMNVLYESGFVATLGCFSDVSREESILSFAHELSYSLQRERVSPHHDINQYQVAHAFFEQWVSWMLENGS